TLKAPARSVDVDRDTPWTPKKTPRRRASRFPAANRSTSSTAINLAPATASPPPTPCTPASTARRAGLPARLVRGGPASLARDPALPRVRVPPRGRLRPGRRGTPRRRARPRLERPARRPAAHDPRQHVRGDRVLRARARG